MQHFSTQRQRCGLQKGVYRLLCEGKTRAMEIGAAAGCVSSLPSVREVRTPAKRVQSYDKKLTSLTVPLGAFGLLLGARSQSRQAPRPGQRLAPQRRYTAETTRVIGDWADGLVEAGEVKLAKEFSCQLRKRMRKP